MKFNRHISLSASFSVVSILTCALLPAIYALAPATAAMIFLGLSIRDLEEAMAGKRRDDAAGETG